MGIWVDNRSVITLYKLLLQGKFPKQNHKVWLAIKAHSVDVGKHFDVQWVPSHNKHKLTWMPEFNVHQNHIRGINEMVDENAGAGSVVASVLTEDDERRQIIADADSWAQGRLL